MYPNAPKASDGNEVALGSSVLGANVSFCKAASMLEVVGVCVIPEEGRTSRVLPKDSCPAIGESEKNCCCITGSTEAATELVDNATLRSTFKAIQSLRSHNGKW